MKNLILLIALAATSSLVFVGCEPVNQDQLARERAKFNSPSGQSKVDVTNDSISGKWLGLCISDSTFGPMFRKDLFEISSNSILYISNYYSDVNCSNLSYSQNTGGSFQLMKDTLYGTTKISINLINILATPFTLEMNNKFNDINFCNSSQWNIGQSLSFSDVRVCGIANSSINKIERFGKNELFLDSLKFIKN